VAFDAPTDRTGAIIADKFVLGRVLGRGGMGVVYEATHRWTGRRVALKLIHPALADDPELATRFLQEARAATRLRHPHVVDVLDMGRSDDGTVYQALALLDGETLGARLKREGRLRYDETLRLLDPLMDALSLAHAEGIIHRDVKPENVFLRRDATGVHAVLLDFGMAKLLDTCSTATPSSAVFGTPHYMAPEQALGASKVGPGADVWSMGALLFACLAGELPFGKLPAAAYLARVVSEDAPAIRKVAPEVAPCLAEVVDRALSRRLSDRYASMAELRAALRDSAQKLGVTFTEVPTERPVPVDPSFSPRRGTRLAWLALVLSVLVASTALGLHGARVQPATAPRGARVPAAKVVTLPSERAAAPRSEGTGSDGKVSAGADSAGSATTAPSKPPRRSARLRKAAHRMRQGQSPRTLPGGMTEEW